MEFQPSYVTPEMVPKPTPCPKIKTNYYSNVLQFEIFWFIQITSFSIYKVLLFLGRRRLIKTNTQTAVINIINLRILYKLDISYASQQTFSKVVACEQAPKRGFG